ncbi:polyprenyl synthetase family protein [Chitinophagaceae bacterium LWZ2-11]
MEQSKKVISAELKQFEIYFKEALASDVPLLNRIMDYVIRQKGKQMRPMFVLLCARLSGAVNERSYRAAMLVEILHTASLVHDDMVDDSRERRGAFSINALWNNRIAVMLGDNMFARGMVLSLSNEDYRILNIYSDAIQQMIESELLQIMKSKKLNLDEDNYYKIINAKTASFLAAACAAGASSTFNDEEQVNKLHLFGEKVGMAFQLKDDIFDYGDAAIGKPTGNDIKEKKITLPLIYTLNNCDPALKKKLSHIVKHQNNDKAKVAYVVEEVIKAGGIQYAEAKMFEFRDEALKILHDFSPSDTRDALEELVRYTTDRSY